MNTCYSSHLKTDIGILTFLLATPLCFASSFHLGVRLPRGSIFLILSFHGMSFRSSCSAPVVFRLHVSTINIPNVSEETDQKKSDWWENPQNVFMKASHYFLQEILPIDCSQASNIKARLTISTSDHFKALLKTLLQWVEPSYSCQHIALKLLYLCCITYTTND